MPDLPSLPLGLQYSAIGIAVLALAGAIAQQLFANWISRTAAAAWARLSARLRWMRRDEWGHYRSWVRRKYRMMRLGFFKDASIAVDDVYVPLQYEYGGQRIDIYRDMQTYQRMVVLGPAGAGKSMLLRHAMLRWAETQTRGGRVPLLVELTRYNIGDRTVFQLLLDVLTARDGARRTGFLVRDPHETLVDALEGGKVCLFLDGLDEVRAERRADIAMEIKDLAERYPSIQLVITCREAVYENELQPAIAREIRVAGFDDAGIRHFLRLWFTRPHDAFTGHHPAPDSPDDPRERVDELMAALRANPTLMRLARTPLLLTMIAALHDADRGAGPILPNSRADFYALAVSHRLSRDRELGRHGSLAHYRQSHKQMVLRTVALAAQGATEAGSDRRVIPEHEVYGEARRIMPRLGLAVSDVRPMIDEIVHRSGLLIRVDDNNMLYEFAHLTLQEYLSAVELGDRPDRLLALYRHSPQRWRETVKLWCGGANRDASDLVSAIFAGTEADQLLALECVAEAKQIDAHLASEITAHFIALLGTYRRDRPLMLAALGAVAADNRPNGQNLFRYISGLARRPDGVGTDAIEVLAESRTRQALQHLSELAQHSRVAERALRSLGELAIPVLAGRAAEGQVPAVDDLAAIGTPAAAVVLAELLWQRSAVAKRAAWQLAVLISAPDVEAELDRLDASRWVHSEQQHRWVWEPFVPAGRGVNGTSVTIGRVAWLIEQSSRSDVPSDLGPVDVRLAVALAVQTRRVRSGAKLPRDVQTRLERPRTLNVSLHRGARDVRKAGRQAVTDHILDIENTNPGRGRLLAMQVVEARMKDWHCPVLLRRAPMAVLVRIIDWLLDDTPQKAGPQQWRALRLPAERTKAWERIRDWLTGVNVLIAVGMVAISMHAAFAAISSATTPVPVWLAAPYPLALLSAVMALLVADELSRFALYPMLAMLPLTAVLSLAISLLTLTGWVGLPGAGLAGIFVVVTAAAAWVAHRSAAASLNLYRRLLDDQALLLPATTLLIEPRGTPAAERLGAPDDLTARWWARQG